MPTKSIIIQYGTIMQFHNVITLAKLDAVKYQTAINAYILTDTFHLQLMEELLFHLGKLVFGTNMVG